MATLPSSLVVLVALRRENCKIVQKFWGQRNQCPLKVAFQASCARQTSLDEESNWIEPFPLAWAAVTRPDTLKSLLRDKQFLHSRK